MTTHRNAFTLIELLVVISIIAILAGLALPAFHKAQVMADCTHDVSNLRLMGSAIASYMVDNDGFFPLAGNSGLYDNYFNNGTIPVVLDPYIGHHPISYPAQASYLTTPLWRKTVGAANVTTIPCYVINTSGAPGDVPTTSSTPKSPTGPFGYGTQGPPKRANAVSLPAETWAISDADQKFAPLNVAGWLGGTPAKPLYGSFRNQLFFDWHVGRLEITPETP
jgi:prepilin-type N-terminal cleavage/methylation domain-containing protein